MVSRENVHSILRIAPAYQPIFRELGIDADAVFDHPLIKAWRTLPGDRQNCTLDATIESPLDSPLGGEETASRSIRWHLKRYAPPPAFSLDTPAAREVKGFRALHAANIPTAALIAWGQLPDGRSFVISDDLRGYVDSEKLLRAGGTTFDTLLEPTADLAAKLHSANLHHRDLYLCHFFVRSAPTTDAQCIAAKLIDVARVRPMTNPITRRRWIVKDLAQFWFSSTSIDGITEDQRLRWLDRYAQQRHVRARSLITAIRRKSDWIARHDQTLRRAQPHRNVSLSPE